MSKKWPDSLPLPLQDGYKLQPVSGVRRTKMQSGRARVRRKFKSVPTIATVTWLMTTEQAAIFQHWFDKYAEDGAAWVDIPLQTPTGGSQAQMYKCRFTDIYDGPNLVEANVWHISAEIEIREQPILQGDWDILPEFLVDRSIFDVAVNDRWAKA